MKERNIYQEFRLKNIDETINYLLEEIEQIKLMSRKHIRLYTTLSYIDHFLILVSSITGCISISAFASLLGILLGTISSTIGLKMCAIAVGTKKYESIINKKKKKYYGKVLLAKSKLNNIGVLIAKDLIDSNISHDEFILINNVLK